MKVTILLSTYNGEQFLAEQIKSIQEQTYRDWQLLIRDDGFTDGTRAVIEDFCRKDERIAFINRENLQNLGVIQSFHSLLQYQDSDFYLFSDQDDVWLPNKIWTCSVSEFPTLESSLMIELGVNIDHVATIRQARRTYEPDPVWAAVEAHLGAVDRKSVV